MLLRVLFIKSELKDSMMQLVYIKASSEELESNIA
jgi:hypothetical protein